MPMRALSACSEPGCSVLLARPGRCALHARKPWAQTLTRMQRGYDATHVRLRAIVLERDPICYLCRQADSTVADHVIPLSRGGQTTLDNMRGACGPCNQAKAGREGGTARRLA